MIHNTKEYWKRYLFILVGLAINIPFCLLSKYFHTLGINLYLDSIGTVLATILCGLVPGIIVALLTAIFKCIYQPLAIYYAFIGTMIAVFSYYFSKRLWFKSFYKPFILVVVLATCGGIFGTITDIMLNGTYVNTVTSSGLATFIYNNVGIKNVILCEILSGFIWDLLDKFIVVAVVFAEINLSPKKFIAWFPRAHIFEMTFKEARENKGEYQDRFTGHKAYTKFSLRKKILLISIFTGLILGLVTATLGSILHIKDNNANYARQCHDTISLARNYIEVDRIEHYYHCSESELPPDYYHTKDSLQKINDQIENIEYIYIYIFDDNHVKLLIDTDSPNLAGSPFMYEVEWDKTLRKYFGKFVEGEEIEPFISNGEFGWLLTVLEPIKDSTGKPIAYIGCDVKMDLIVIQLISFIARICALFALTCVIITSLVYEFTRARIIQPLNDLAYVADSLASSEDEIDLSVFNDLSIKPGDEMDNLSKSLYVMADNLNEYMKDLRSQNRYVRKLQENIIYSFANMADNRDGLDGFHTRRTAEYAYVIAKQLSKLPKYKKLMNQKYLYNIRLSAPLHDIGKIAIPDAILSKPGKLTDEEYNIMKRHTTEGERILRSAVDGIEDKDFLNMAVDLSAYHHEWWNGKGYPLGLQGSNIPLAARIMAVADVYDALVSKRCYKDAYPFEEAINIMHDETGTHFDPEIIEAFDAAIEDIKKISEQYK